MNIIIIIISRNYFNRTHLNMLHTIYYDTDNYLTTSKRQKNICILAKVKELVLGESETYFIASLFVCKFYLPETSILYDRVFNLDK